MSAPQKSVAIKAAIAALEIKLAAALVAEAKNIDIRAIDGLEVAYNYGKGEAKVLKSGVVLGVSFPAEGVKGAPFVRILSGKGANSQIDSVNESALVKVLTPAPVVTEYSPADPV